VEEFGRGVLFPVACELLSELQGKQVQPAPVRFGSNSYYNLLRDSLLFDEEFIS